MSPMMTGLSPPWRAAHAAGARRSPPLFDERTPGEGRFHKNSWDGPSAPSRQPLLNGNVEPQWSTAGERKTGHNGRSRPNSTSFLKLLHMLIKAAVAVSLTRFRPCPHQQMFIFWLSHPSSCLSGSYFQKHDESKAFNYSFLNLLTEYLVSLCRVWNVEDGPAAPPMVQV